MIPSTILPYVFQHLNDRELLQVSLVCRQWYQLTFDPLLGCQWHVVNFQEKVQRLLTQHVKESVIVTSRLKKEEKVDWKRIYELVLKRGKHHLHYLKLWSCFSEQQLPIIIENPTLDQLMILDLRGTHFDITCLLKPQPQNSKAKVESKKLIELKDNDTENNNNNNNNNHDESNQKDNNNTKKEIENNHNNENSVNKKQDITTNDKPSSSSAPITSKTSSTSSSSSSSNKNSKPLTLLDFFKNLKFVYLRGCKNVTEETVKTFQKTWPNIQLDIKICDTCHTLTRRCRDQALNLHPQTALTNDHQTSPSSSTSTMTPFTHCQVCKKEHCDHCRPLWTCNVCGGGYACEDCRAHGLRCTTCDTDFCYTCQHPKKVLECRYCHSMSCGQSDICQTIGYRYQACHKCDYYVCMTCRNEHKSLIACSGRHCNRTFCKTCINESTSPSLISFDKAEVEQRIRDSGFGLCSYCNKLYCQDCLFNNSSISLYGGSPEFPYSIVLCAECESFYKTQLLNLFKASPPPPLSNTTSTSSSNVSRRHYHPSQHTPTHTNHGTSTGRAPSSSYTNNLLILTNPSNLLTNNSLSLESPIDIFNDDRYIR